MAGEFRNARTRTTPIPVVRSNRLVEVRHLSSFMPGKMVPLVAIPLLREDKLNFTRMRVSIEQMETAEILVNAVNVRVMAYLVPNSAFERFNGMDQLNRSYMKEVEDDGGTVTPFFTTHTAGAHGADPIHLAMGLHAKQGTVINSAYREAYNTIWNMRVTNRSPDIPKRLVTDNTLAPAFWNHEQFAAIVPDFDQAIIDGEVALNVTNAQMPVTGIGLSGTVQTSQVNAGPIRTTKAGQTGETYPFAQGIIAAGGSPAANQAVMFVETKGNTSGQMSWPQIFAELQDDGITVSLSNIEMARKTQAFAALRKQYTGHSDDYIIDLLMQGISVPDQAWRQPMLLADKSTIIGMNKRYASDSLDLTASVTNGGTFVDIGMTTPRCPPGGVVMVLVEVTPEQLFERQADPYLMTTDQDTLPDYLRDTLDPEKVEVVKNSQIDVEHATPTATFGYAPLNWKWSHHSATVGGKFFRPTVDLPADEDRMRLWACEAANPVLSRDFYLCTTIHNKVFVVTNQDPYEVVVRGMASINGNTVFGHLLVEASDDYDQVMAEAPIDRIDKPVTTEAVAEEVVS